jgi:hypothetical protein
MNRSPKDMRQELEALRNRLKALLDANMGEARRTVELLRATEQKVEDRFGHIDSLETVWEITSRKFRKKPVLATATRQESNWPPVQSTELTQR